MNKKEFIELIGENPEDMFGGDWENTLADMIQDEEYRQGEERENLCEN